MKRSESNRLKRSQSGFSLIEIMIAFAILSFGILTMTLMQLTALKQGGAGRHTTDAAAIGRTYLEQVHRLPWGALTAVQDNGWTNPAWAGALSSVNTMVISPGGNVQIENSYGVQWRVTTIATSTCMLDVEMRVTWSEPGEQGNQKNLNLATRRYNWGNASC